MKITNKKDRAARDARAGKTLLPAGGEEHRARYAKYARDGAYDLLATLGDGVLPNQHFYKGLPVGLLPAERVTEFLDTVKRMALEAFDASVAARDLPASDKVVAITRKRRA